jgi:hypothetical protein
MTMAKPPATQTKSPEEAAMRYQKMREASVKRSISVVQPEKEVRSSILTLESLAMMPLPHICAVYYSKY